MRNEPKDLYSLVAKNALRNPEDISFITLDKKLSFHELLHSIDRAADMFWQMGIRKNDKFAIALKNSIEFVIS
ncbi:MAG: AMP-binding protein, partial [Elusimicrobiota bacterium]|nr:AMP-binding protein [Elusimicrobiota bacterium]